MIGRFERFSYAIFEISRCWHKLAAEEMEKYGLRGPFAVYLIALQNSPEGLTAVRLCELCARDKADVSRAVSLMVRKGFIKRKGLRYRALLQLTDAGREAAQHVCKRAATAVELAGKGFSEEERETFYQVLGTITANLQQLSKDGLPETAAQEGE